MIFLFLPGRRSLIGHVIYGVRSAMLVSAVLVLAPHFAEADRQPDFDETTPRQEGKGNERLLGGAVTHVRDGDTVEVTGVPVRITNLDCAEAGTQAGRRAKHSMQRLAAAGPMTCRLSGRKSYDREIGTCLLADGRDVGTVLIAEGVCSPWQ